jgi:cytidylate kinase
VSARTSGRGGSAVRIAIDGPSASGKSAAGSRVAARLGVPFVDTGSMYRALTWLALQADVDVNDPAALAALAEETTLTIGPPPAEGMETCSIAADGVDITPFLRDPAVERNVSAVSAVPAVRAVMVHLQREAAPADVVMAGRDIGTVVLPDAELKVYFEASVDVRAARRYAELLDRGREVTPDGVRADLERRDALDSSRATSPLRPAKDAVIIHTDQHTLEGVVERVLALVAEREAMQSETHEQPAAAQHRPPRDRAPRAKASARSTQHAALLAPRAWWPLIFYWLMTRLMRLVVWSVGRYEVHGAERVPRHGPLIVVSNHLNNADPPLLGAALPRRLRFMAKQELFETRFGVFMRWFGAFPVRRFEADLTALRQAQAIVNEGGALAMFPEGHRSRTSGWGPPHPGTALIALRTGAPLLPVAITGTERIRSPLILFRKPPIRVVVGEPFTLPAARRVTSEAVQAGAEEIMHRIAALLPPGYRGIYGDGGEGTTETQRK